MSERGEASSRRTVRYIVHGHVQGVWFRAFTQDQARRLGVAGWVRNRADGTVECVACGDDESLARLRSALERGSPASQVERVEEAAVEPFPGSGFEIRR